MDNRQLFIALLHRLRKYSDTLVLYVALEQHADEMEFKTSTTKLALDLLGGVIDRFLVQRSLKRLSDLGLVEVRTHANYRTHIKVDREAVNALLRTPVSPMLPGIRRNSFPFLDYVNADTRPAEAAEPDAA